MSLIKNTFKINIPHLSHSVMYSELTDGRFVKTYLKGSDLKTEFIRTQEYASALTLFHIQNLPTKKPWPIHISTHKIPCEYTRYIHSLYQIYTQDILTDIHICVHGLGMAEASGWYAKKYRNTLPNTYLFVPRMPRLTSVAFFGQKRG